MTKAEAIKALRAILARLYGDDVDRIIRDAGLNAAYINKGRSPITYWFNIIDEAEKRNKLDALLQAVYGDYGADDPEFQVAYQAYLVATGQPAVAISALLRPVKILLLAANPSDTDPLQLADEVRAIKEALRKTPFYERFRIEQEWAVRYTDLQGLLMEHKPDIVHFSGHGSTVGELKLQDESGASHLVSAQALTQLFTLLKGNIRCVVLNACYTDIQGAAIAEQIDAVIGMSHALGDDSAIDFAAGFYEALGFGQNVKAAFELGRNRIDLAGLPDAELPQLLTLNSDPAKLIFVAQ